MGKHKDKAIRLAHAWVDEELLHEGMDAIEAALTAAHDAGDKQGYARGWNEGVEAAVEVEPDDVSYDPERNDLVFDVLRAKEESIHRLKKGPKGGHRHH